VNNLKFHDGNYGYVSEVYSDVKMKGKGCDQIKR